MMKLVTSAQFRALANKYDEVAKTTPMLFPESEDPMFYVGVLATLLNFSDLEFPDKIKNDNFNLSIFFYTLHACKKIRNLIGDKGYDDILNSMSSPYYVHKEIRC